MSSATPPPPDDNVVGQGASVEPVTLLEQLLDLAAAETTGLLFLTLQGNRQAFISVERGRVANARYGREEGETALGQVLSSPILAMRFMSGPLSGSRQLDLGREELLGFYQLLQDVLPNMAPPPPIPLTEELKAELGKLLAEAIGPAGLMLAQRVFAKTDDVTQIVSDLTKVIPDLTYREAFSSRVRTMLAKYR